MDIISSPSEWAGQAAEDSLYLHSKLKKEDTSKLRIIPKS